MPLSVTIIVFSPDLFIQCRPSNSNQDFLFITLTIMNYLKKNRNRLTLFCVKQDNIMIKDERGYRPHQNSVARLETCKALS